LESAGYAVEVAMNGIEALEKTLYARHSAIDPAQNRVDVFHSLSPQRRKPVARNPDSAKNAE
jgi:hypothetical protein